MTSVVLILDNISSDIFQKKAVSAQKGCFSKKNDAWTTEMTHEYLPGVITQHNDINQQLGQK